MTVRGPGEKKGTQVPQKEDPPGPRHRHHQHSRARRRGGPCDICARRLP